MTIYWTNIAHQFFWQQQFFSRTCYWKIWNLKLAPRSQISPVLCYFERKIENDYTFHLTLDLKSNISPIEFLCENVHFTPCSSLPRPFIILKEISDCMQLVFDLFRNIIAKILGWRLFRIIPSVDFEMSRKGLASCWRFFVVSATHSTKANIGRMSIIVFTFHGNRTTRRLANLYQ